MRNSLRNPDGGLQKGMTKKLLLFVILESKKREYGGSGYEVQRLYGCVFYCEI